MIRGLYDWTMSLAGHRRAMLALAIVSFIESSVFPIPPDILIIPMVLASRKKAWRIALLCSVASVLGGLAGYGIGYFFYESLGRAVLDLYGYADEFIKFQGFYHQWGAWIVAGAGFTFFPYKLVTIASGVTNMDVIVFTVASALSRGLRFFLVAGLLWYFGDNIRIFIEKNLGILTTIFFVLLFAGFILVKYLI
ncbi:MAG: cytochrome B [Magnetovibrio sp.]|nr:cytochrome B [Magnetovibrio sp.]